MIDGLRIRRKERSLLDLDRELELEAERHKERFVTPPRKVRRARPPRPSQACEVEFLCAGCGELVRTLSHGGPLPRFCGPKCKARVWRIENPEAARAAERRYECKRSGRHGGAELVPRQHLGRGEDVRCLWCMAPITDADRAARAEMLAGQGK